MRSSALVLGAAVLTVAVAPTLVCGQDLPLLPLRGTDQGVWPAFEGWYDNEDGTNVIYFGYYNRNTDQVIDIPLGANNFIEPAEFDGDQPTHFETRRHWGVFGIRVPADYGAQNRIYWNLVIDGETYRVPGHMQADYKTDALDGGASNNTPPVLTFGSAEGHGPLGVTAPETLRTAAGEPVEVRVSAMDSGPAGRGGFGGRGGGRGGGGPRVTLAWFKHQGPGDVSFTEEQGRVSSAGGEMTTMATFSEPGDYILRVRATDSGVSGAGHAQCCWTNGFVRVTVTR